MREIKFRVWDGEEMHYRQGDLPHEFSIFTGKWRNKGSWCEVNPDIILMQYTGLKDKNGKEIYEGDILKYDSEHTQEVCWHNGSMTGFDIGHLLINKAKIIGNIYENPLLVKKQK